MSDLVPREIATDFWPHPITTEGREVVVALPGQTLEEVFAGRVSRMTHAVAIVNGSLYARHLWDQVVLRDGDVVQVRLAVGGDANPFAIIATIAVLVAAPFLAPGVAGAFGITSAVGIGVVEALISVGGILLANSLFPPRLPQQDERGPSRLAERLYTLSGGSNRARPYQPLQLLLGTHRHFPDLVSQEYRDFNDEGDQFLNIILDAGLGNLQQGDLKFGETDITDFENVSTQTDVERVTLVAGNVDTIDGGDLESGTPISRTTAADTTAVGFDIVSQHFTIDEESGETVGMTALFSVEWREVGSGGSWQRRVVRLATPDGPEARNATRRSYKYTTGKAAAWDVRITLDTAVDPDDDRAQLNAQCAFRAFQDSDADFTGRHPIAIRAKATGQLYGRLEGVNQINSQLVDSWNGFSWVPNQVSGNCGDVLLAYYRGWYVGGRLVAGMGLPDERIDFQAIQQFAEHCTTNELEVNLILENTRDHIDMITLICQCGWGTHDRQSGKWGVVWEDANRPITAIINPDNVIAGSMHVTYNHENLADEVVGNFIDRMSDYAVNQIRRGVPGATNPEFPVEIDLEGVVNGEHAAKELNRQVAAQFYHTRVISWEMTLQESISIARGDVVGATHDIVGGGSGGRFFSIDAARTGLALTKDVEASGYIWIWDLHGDIVERNYTRTAEAAITLSAALPLAPSGVNDDPLAYRFMTFPSASMVRKLRVVGKESSSDDRVRFLARDEVEEYYQHRTSDLTWTPLPVGTASYLAPVTGFTVTEDFLGVRIFAWTAHPDPIIVGYQIRYAMVGTNTWDAMTALHEGNLTASPLEVVGRPPAGTWRFAIVGVLADGRRTAPRFVTATLGDVVLGVDGQDGNGIEYIFAATENPSLPAAMRPNNDWTFDMPGTSGGLRWYDGASPEFSETKRYMWRAVRAVPGTPDPGTDIEGLWQEPRIVGVWGQAGVAGIAGADGTDGLPGADGVGREYVFAVTATGSIPASMRPSNAWGYDSPGTAGGLTWHDGAPGITDALPYLWRAERRVVGSPMQGDIVPDAWSMPRIVGRVGLQGIEGADGQDGAPGIAGADGADAHGVEWIFARTAGETLPSSQYPSNSWGFDVGGTRGGLTWTDGAPTLTEALSILWRAYRDITGAPARGDAVTDTWSTPVIVGRFGDDGTGLEYIFARTDMETLEASKYPSNSWGFDNPGTSDGLTWTDAAENLTNDFPILWRSQRRVKGVPAFNAAVSDNWTTPVVVGRRGIDGSANRAPGIYHIPVNEAQQAILEAGSATILQDTTLQDLANDATPGDNIFGDTVRFYRGSLFAKFYSWANGQWNALSSFIGAEYIVGLEAFFHTLTVNLANVTGTLSAAHIDADVRNWQNLFDGNAVINAGLDDDDGDDVTLSTAIGSYSSIAIFGFWRSNGSDFWVPNVIHQSLIPTSGNTQRLDRFDNNEIRIRRNSAGTVLNFQRRTGEAKYHIQEIWGVRNPGSATPSPTPPSPPSPTPPGPPTPPTPPTPATPNLDLTRNTITDLAEGGEQMFQVRLTSQPSEAVTVSITESSSAISLLDTSLSFSTSNWNTYQSVRVEGEEDADTDDESATILLTASGGSTDVKTVTVTVLDDDSPSGVMNLSRNNIPDLAEGGTQMFQVRLSRQPTGTVTVSISESDSDITVSPSSLSFTTANWDDNQAVMVTGVQDADTQDDTATITLNATGGGYSDTKTVTVTILDDDSMTPTPTPPTPPTPTPPTPPTPTPPTPTPPTPPTPPLTATLSVSDSSPDFGDVVNISVSPSGGVTPYSYAWTQTGGATLTISGGANTADISVTMPSDEASADTFTFQCRITDSASSVITRSAVISLEASLSSSLSVSDTTPDAGDTVTLTAVASGGTSPYTYAWTKTAGTTALTITNANSASATVTLPSDTESGTYSFRCLVSDSAGNAISKVVSFNVGVGSLSASFSVSPGQNVTVGDDVTITLSVTGGVTPYTFEWTQTSGTDVTFTGDGTNAISFTAPAYDPPNHFLRFSTEIESSDGQTLTRSSLCIVNPA